MGLHRGGILDCHHGWAAGKRLDPGSEQFSASTRMQPGRQERIRVDAQAPVVRSAVLIEKRLQATGLVGIEDIGATTDEFAPNEDLRNGGYGGASSQRRADSSAAIVFLILDRVQINRAITDAVASEHLANC